MVPLTGWLASTWHALGPHSEPVPEDVGTPPAPGTAVRGASGRNSTAVTSAPAVTSTASTAVTTIERGAATFPSSPAFRSVGAV